MNLIASPFLRHLVAMVLAFLAYIPGQTISWGTQLSLFNELKTAAGIIFGVLGIWIAVVYPAALKTIITGATDTETAKLETIIRPVRYATWVLAAAILLPPIAATSKQFMSLLQYRHQLLGISFSLHVYLSLSLLWTLLLSLAPTEMIYQKLRQADHNQQNLERFQKLTRRAP